MEESRLSKFPRSGRTLLMGIPWLSRAIDKARMTLDGYPGDYVFPCPIDEELLRFLDLTPFILMEILKNAPDDKAVLETLSWKISSLGPAEWMWIDVFLVRHSRLLDDQDREEGRL